MINDKPSQNALRASTHILTPGQPGLKNGIYEGIPHGNVKLAYSEIFLMLNLIYSEFSCGQCSKCDRGVPACEPTRGNQISNAYYQKRNYVC